MAKHTTKNRSKKKKTRTHTEKMWKTKCKQRTNKRMAKMEWGGKCEWDKWWKNIVASWKFFRMAMPHSHSLFWRSIRRRLYTIEISCEFRVLSRFPLFLCNHHTNLLLKCIHMLFFFFLLFSFEWINGIPGVDQCCKEVAGLECNNESQQYACVRSG